MKIVLFRTVIASVPFLVMITLVEFVECLAQITRTLKNVMLFVIFIHLKMQPMSAALLQVGTM